MGKNTEKQNRFLYIMNWRNSEEYRSICIERGADCDRLLRIGEEFLRKPDMEAHIRSSIHKIAYASGGNMHRGPYCPSPVLDLLIGNLRRGRLLKHAAPLRKAKHRYGLDSSGKLVICEKLSENQVRGTEYIFHQDTCRYGVAVSEEQELLTISEEIFQDKKLSRYEFLTVYPDEEGYFCANLHVERFWYDDQGLCYSEREYFEPYVNVFQRYCYCFTRKDGYLIGYSASEFAGTTGELLSPSDFYITGKRKA